MDLKHSTLNILPPSPPKGLPRLQQIKEIDRSVSHSPDLGNLNLQTNRTKRNKEMGLGIPFLRDLIGILFIFYDG